jgi:hypothetical protein
MPLGSAATARVRLIVWCKACHHQVEPDPAEMARRYGAEMTLLDWRDRLACSRCAGREIDMVVTGERPIIAWPKQAPLRPGGSLSLRPYQNPARSRDAHQLRTTPTRCVNVPGEIEVKPYRPLALEPR